VGVDEEVEVDVGGGVIVGVSIQLFRELLYSSSERQECDSLVRNYSNCSCTKKPMLVS